MEDKRNMVNNINKMIVVQGGDNNFLFSNQKSYINVNAWLEKFRDKEPDKRMTIVAVASDEFEIVSKSISDECTVIKSEKVKQFFSFEEKERYEFLLKNYDSILVEAILRFEECRDNDNFTFGNAFDIAFVDLFLLQKQLENKD